MEAKRQPTSLSTSRPASTSKRRSDRNDKTSPATNIKVTVETRNNITRPGCERKCRAQLVCFELTGPWSVSTSHLRSFQDELRENVIGKLKESGPGSSYGDHLRQDVASRVEHGACHGTCLYSCSTRLASLVSLRLSLAMSSSSSLSHVSLWKLSLQKFRADEQVNSREGSETTVGYLWDLWLLGHPKYCYIVEARNDTQPLLSQDHSYRACPPAPIMQVPRKILSPVLLRCGSTTSQGGGGRGGAESCSYCTVLRSYQDPY